MREKEKRGMSEYQEEQGSEVRFVNEGYGENGIEERESGIVEKIDRQKKKVMSKGKIKREKSGNALQGVKEESMEEIKKDKRWGK